jgi:hypothetical protein
MEMEITQYCRIWPGRIELNGELFFASGADAQTFLSQAYGQLATDCRRFFKMDLLSKLGFIASELLLKDCDREQPKEDTGIILFNRSSSLDTDSHFQQTVGHADRFFPSPAVFVYTLPNIVTGEIAIRHRIHGETAFYVLPSPDFPRMETLIRDTVQSAGLRRVLAGWLEAHGEILDARLMLCTAGHATN